MDRINRIVSGLYVGGDPCYSVDLQSDLDLIYEEDLVVIDCRSLSERFDGWDQIVEGQDIVRVNLHDDGFSENDTAPFTNLKYELQSRGLMDRGKFIHCHMGVNRAPSVAMYLLMLGGMPAVTAFKRIRSRRTGAGLAYAGLAVRAASNNQHAANVNGRKFEQWESRYWDEHGFSSVNEAIRNNRALTSRRGGTWIDDEGLMHVINTRD